MGGAGMRRAKAERFARVTPVLRRYARTNGFRHYAYNEEIHQRIVSPIVVMDFWPTTGKYYIKETDYSGSGALERAGETGWLPEKVSKIEPFLDQVFFAIDLA